MSDPSWLRALTTLCVTIVICLFVSSCFSNLRDMNYESHLAEMQCEKTP